MSQLYVFQYVVCYSLDSPDLRDPLKHVILSKVALPQVKYLILLEKTMFKRLIASLVCIAFIKV